LSEKKLLLMLTVLGMAAVLGISRAETHQLIHSERFPF